MAGVDWCSDCSGSPNGAFIFGLMAGYSDFNAKFNAGVTPPSIEGSASSIGAYATFLKGGFFADALLKVDFPDLTISVPSLALFGTSAASTDGQSVGGTLDTGCRHPINTAS